MTNFQKVKKFMQTFGQEVKLKPSFSSEKINELRYNLIKEELPFIKIPDSITELDLMVMKEADNLRKTYLLNRGAYDSPTDIELNGSMPSVILPFKQNFEKIYMYKNHQNLRNLKFFISKRCKSLVKLEKCCKM